MITVGELREKLDEWADNLPVYFAVHNPRTATEDEEPNKIEFSPDDINNDVDERNNICVVIAVHM